MKLTPLYYLFSKLMYFIITRCLLGGVVGWGGGVEERVCVCVGGQHDQ